MNAWITRRENTIKVNTVLNRFAGNVYSGTLLSLQ